MSTTVQQGHDDIPTLDTPLDPHSPGNLQVAGLIDIAFFN